MLRRRIGCRAHPPRVTPERSMTVVVEAIIAGLSLSMCACAGTGREANCRFLQLTIPVDPGAKKAASFRRKVWWSCDVDGRWCGAMRMEDLLGSLWCAVEAKAFEALPMVPLLHYLVLGTEVPPPSPPPPTSAPGPPELSRACRAWHWSYVLSRPPLAPECSASILLTPNKDGIRAT